MPAHIEKIIPCNNIALEPDQRIFLRLRLDQEAEFAINTTPMLFAQAPELNCKYWDQAFKNNLINAHVSAASKLKKSGFDTCVIAADDDGCLHKLLSPRFSQDGLLARVEPLLLIYKAVSAIFPKPWVLLSIEELAPGGFDATDGIEVARKLESLGLENLIIASGTKDFPPLYERRLTKNKDPEQPDFSSHEPGMASTLWALEHTKLTIWYCGFIQNPTYASALATELGLAGVIVKDYRSKIG